jgi:hypothetical protein
MAPLPFVRLHYVAKGLAILETKRVWDEFVRARPNYAREYQDAKIRELFDRNNGE